MKGRGTLPYFALSAAVLILDQITKYWISKNLPLYGTVTVNPFFQIVHVQNTGSAFGMFKSLGNGFFIAIALCAIAAIAVFLVRQKEDRLPLSLVMGGAAGNLADRMTHGYVVDFLDFFLGTHHWPAFNVADSALTVGITLLAAGMFIRGGHMDKS